MNHTIYRYSAFLLLSAFISSPFLSFAQSTTTIQDGSTNSIAAQRDYIRGWRRGSNELQDKINTLGTTSTFSVYMPVLFGVEIKNITPNFGDPRSGGRSHQGEDIMAVKGTPIVSPTPAIVVRTGIGPSEGIYVYTANPGGETFVYMHLDKLGEGVTPGTVLEKGSLIGYVGNTGNASGGAAHLHFEIHDTNGNAINPFLRLLGEFTLEEKNTYITKILTQTSDPGTLALLLINNFRSTFNQMKYAGLTLSQNISYYISPSPASPSVVPAPTTSVKISSGLTLSRNLYKTLTGEDVRTLQKFLNTHGYVIATNGAGSPGNETTYFGAATVSAVIRFQKANNISPAVGYIGAITRAKLSSL